MTDFIQASLNLSCEPKGHGSILPQTLEGAVLQHYKNVDVHPDYGTTFCNTNDKLCKESSVLGSDEDYEGTRT